MSKNQDERAQFLFQPIHPEQSEALQVLRSNDIVFVSGATGTSKTTVAVAYAVEMIQKGKMDKILVVRPLVTAGENLGYFKGDFHDKIDNWSRGFKDVLSNMVVGTEGTIDRFFDRHFEFFPIGYSRGRTYSRMIVILDEAQNCTDRQLDLMISRIARNSKLLILGDPAQCDLERPDKQLGFGFYCQELKGVQIIDPGNHDRVYSVGHVHLTVQCRHPLITAIEERIRLSRSKSRKNRSAN